MLFRNWTLPLKQRDTQVCILSTMSEYRMVNTYIIFDSFISKMEENNIFFHLDDVYKEFRESTKSFDNSLTLYSLCCISIVICWSREQVK